MMSVSDDDRGLDLRLPWGRPVARLPAAETPPPAPSPVEPASVGRPSPSGETRSVAEPSLLLLVERFGRLEEQLEALSARVPDRLEQIEARLVMQQAVTADAFEKLQSWTQALDKMGDELTRRLDALITEVQEELAQLTSRIEQSERATLEALAKLAPPA